MDKAFYDPSAFDVSDIESAKRIILNSYPGATTEERWAKETKYLAHFLQAYVTSESVVLDYGCGVGRLAKALIEITGCFVIGVDISPSMRTLSNLYVNSDRFFVCGPPAISLLSRTVDVALSIWVLQHVIKPKVDIELIKSMLKPGGSFFVLNNHGRCVPATLEGEPAWINDDICIDSSIQYSNFRKIKEGKLPPAVCNESMSENSFWAWYSLG